MTAIRVYGSPRCPTCDAALALVRSTGRAVRQRDVFAEPLAWDELKHLAALAGGVRHILSVRAPAYRTLRLDAPGVAEPALLAAMVREPSLLRRPIIRAEGMILVGFDGHADEHGTRP